MQEQPKVFRRATTEFQPYGEGSGNASIARLVGPQDSRTMGAYLARFDERPVAWTVRYDEVIVCVEGVFKLTADGVVHELQPGDVIWIPEGTGLVYDGAYCLVFIAIAPVDWRARRSEAGGS
jgi:ethanolamine utilization protein EutQ